MARVQLWKAYCLTCRGYSFTTAHDILLRTGKRGINPLEPEAVVVPHQIIWSWYTGRWWVGCYIWYSEEGTGRAPSLPRPILVPNVTAHPSTASVPISVLVYNGPLLCGFSVGIKGLNHFCSNSTLYRFQTNDVRSDTTYENKLQCIWQELLQLNREDKVNKKNCNPITCDTVTSRPGLTNIAPHDIVSGWVLYANDDTMQFL